MLKRLSGPKSSQWFRAVFRHLLVAGWLVGLVATGLLAGLAQAAPPAQEEPTATATLLPALPAPPVDGAVVAVRTLAVYDGPGIEFTELGGLPYGAIIYPQARTEDVRWLRIDYAGFDGWIESRFVTIGFNAAALPISTLAGTPGADETLLPAISPTVAPSATATPQPPLATPTPETTEVAAPVIGASDAGGDGNSLTISTPLPDGSAPPPERNPAMVGITRLGLAVLAVLALALSVRYILSLRASEQLNQKGFPISRCPACRQGRLSIEEVAPTRWVVRCDNCRSILRRQRGGKWRYAVDPVPDSVFAERFNGKVLSEVEIAEIATKRMPVLRSGD